MSDELDRKELRISVFSNMSKVGMRIVHIPTGIVVDAGFARSISQIKMRDKLIKRLQKKIELKENDEESMGQSTNGILAYGFDVGGPEEGWKIEESDEYGDWNPPWLEEARQQASEKEREFVCLDEVAEERLLALAGFTETNWQVDGYHVRKREAEKNACAFVTHCSGSYPMYLLAAWSKEVHRGSVEDIDFYDLERQRAEQDWDCRLTAALADLGMTPKQPEARWMLVSYWGN